ncbi:MAG: PadR family transcriptional regulator [Thermoproteota archaeon]
MAYERLVEKLTKENLWLYILTMLREKPMYGYEIAGRLRSDFKIPIATITAYVVLYKMEREGLVERVMEPEGGGGGRINVRKVYYRQTDKGRDTLEKGIEYIRGILQTLEGAGRSGSGESQEKE